MLECKQDKKRVVFLFRPSKGRQQKSVEFSVILLDPNLNFSPIRNLHKVKSALEKRAELLIFHKLRCIFRFSHAEWIYRSRLFSTNVQSLFFTQNNIWITWQIESNANYWCNLQAGVYKQCSDSACGTITYNSQCVNLFYNSRCFCKSCCFSLFLLKWFQEKALS